MGQSGLSFGLALYEDWRLLKRIFAGDLGDEENARRTVATTMDFREAAELPAADVEAATRYGWKIARPGVYPSVYHKERGMSIRPPLAWELELMTGCLRAVPEHVSRYRQGDPARNEIQVPAPSGELRMALSWMVED